MDAFHRVCAVCGASWAGIVYGKPRNAGVNKMKAVRNLRSIAEERAGKKIGGLRVLNSYWVGEDARHRWYEVTREGTICDRALRSELQAFRIRRGYVVISWYFGALQFSVTGWKQLSARREVLHLGQVQTS